MKRFLSMLLTIGLLFAGGVTFASQAQAADKWKVALVGGWQGLGETAREARNSCYSKEFGDRPKVKVVDERGKTVGLGVMKWSKGKVVDDWARNPEMAGQYEDIRFSVDCVFRAKFPVDKAKFYDVTINGDEVGTYSYKEMKKDKFLLVLSYG